MQGCIGNANIYTAIVAACWVLNLILERWLGRTDRVKAASTFDLIVSGVVIVAALISRKGNKDGISSKAS